MCWVAAQRGAELADVLRAAGTRRATGRRGPTRAPAHSRPAPTTRSSGSSRRRSTAQHPDASNLLLPTLGIDRSDRSAVRLHGPRLREAPRRQRPDAALPHPDDFGATTSAFSICSFWWVEALAMMGELDEAVALFNRLLGIRQSARTVLRRHRAADRRPARQLPAGVHARRPDPRRDHDRRDARSAHRSFRAWT